MFIKETNVIKGNVVNLYDQINMKQSSMSFPSQSVAAEFMINGNMNATEPVYAAKSECQVLDDEDEDEDDEDEEDDDEDDDEDDEDDAEDDEDDDDAEDTDDESILYTGEEVECDKYGNNIDIVCAGDDDDFSLRKVSGTNDLHPLYKKIVVKDDMPSDNVTKDMEITVVDSVGQISESSQHSVAINEDSANRLDDLGDIKIINMEETPNEEKFEEVEKISSNDSIEPSVTSSSQTNDALEIYKKMNINALKAEVVSKGLCSDTSKLKKADIMKLLEKYHKEQ
jgi:hypothetical protein